MDTNVEQISKTEMISRITFGIIGTYPKITENPLSYSMEISVNLPSGSHTLLGMLHSSLIKAFPGCIAIQITYSTWAFIFPR